MRWLVIHLDLLTDRYVAGETNDREAPEWPPHPGRLFMALAATCFETGGSDEDVASLRWLEQQNAPEIHSGAPHARTKAAVYVPVNDKPTGGGILQTAPGMSRSRQERTFPTIVPESSTVRMVWALNDDAEVPIESLDRLCGEMIRVGHSSSLVRAAALVRQEPPASEDTMHRWTPVDSGGDASLRIPAGGALQRLVVDGKRESIDRFAELSDAIDQSKGKQKKQWKQRFEDEFGVAYKQSVRPPEPTPVTIRTWQSYRQEVRQEGSSEALPKSGQTEPLQPLHLRQEMIVLSKHDGPNFSLSDTLMLTRQLRRAILDKCHPQPAPDWISGHDSRDTPTRSPHIALVPLPYAGTRYADGHLMGLAILTPGRIASSEIGRSLGPVMVGDDGLAKTVTLRFQTNDECELRMEERDEPAVMLRDETWLRSSRVWSSVTPVVLDRYPKADRRKDPGRWREEVAKIVWRSCGYAGIHPPSQIEVSMTAFVRGVPRATQKKQRSRDTAGGSTRSIGDGFPPYTVAAGKPPRVQIHVRMTFDQPHSGPICVGAGRFLGYGFFKPEDRRGAKR